MTPGFAPSGAQFEIRHGGQRAVVVEVGGGVRRYQQDGVDVLDGYARETMCSGARGYPLIPWPNRIADGRYTFRGADYQLPLTEPARGNAIHGLLRWRPWSPRELADDHVLLGATLHPTPGYPFALDVTVGYALSDDGLTVTTTATNIGDRACPYATGHHPYLTAGTDTIDACVLTLPAETWLAPDERGLPTARRRVDGTDHDFRAGRRLGDQAIDASFTDLERDASGAVVVEITEPGGRSVLLWADDSYRYLQVFTGDTLEEGKRRRGLAVEPMTAPANAFVTGEGLIELAPGQSTTSRWGVRARGA